VEGDGTRILRRAGYDARRFIALPAVSRPRLVLDPAHGPAAAYGISASPEPATRVRRGRRRAAAMLLRHGRLPPGLPVLTVGGRAGHVPFLIAAGQRELDLPTAPGWFLAGGAGDDLSRGVFFLFAPRDATPSWALKFVRVRGYDAPFVREERALRDALCFPAARNHIPTPIALGTTDGFAWSLETAAVGRRLDSHLRTADRALALAAVDAVADWLVAVGRDSRAPASALRREWRRLLGVAAPVGLSLADEPPVDAVLQHNDLGPWNVISDGERFIAVDWESARRHGLPLWDLWYFLAHALPQIDGAGTADLGVDMLRLFRGEHRLSPVYFDWTRRYMAALDVPRNAVGTLAALCWLHHATSHRARTDALASTGVKAEILDLPTRRLGEQWLADPGLGTAWRCLGE